MAKQPPAPASLATEQYYMFGSQHETFGFKGKY